MVVSCGLEARVAERLLANVCRFGARRSTTGWRSQRLVFDDRPAVKVDDGLEVPGQASGVQPDEVACAAAEAVEQQRRLGGDRPHGVGAISQDAATLGLDDAGWGPGEAQDQKHEER